jgi:hypothetical protein
MPYLPALSPLGELVTNKVERQVAREVRRIQASGAVVAAHHNARVDAIAEVTETALLATSHVSAIEALLVARTPHAEGRLRHIADAGCTGMANVVLDSARSI